MNIGNLRWRLGLDDKGLKKDAAKSGKEAGQAAGAEAGKGMTGGLKKAMSGSNIKQGLLQGLGIGAALGGVSALTAGVSALTDVVLDSIDAASDQREAMALNEQVFKDSADAIDKWSDTTAKSMGESKTAAINFAAGFGNSLKAAGMATDEMATKSIELAERAADLGSAFNASGEEVATAIKSGLTGESEPLRRFGVLLSDAKVKAKGLEMGLVKVGEELTEGQKVLARYQIILDESSDSAGMYGRDAGSMADKQKELNARWQDSLVVLGEKLLPFIVEAQTALLDLADSVTTAATAFGEANVAIGDFKVDISDTQGAALDLAVVIGKLTTGVAALEAVQELLDDDTKEATAAFNDQYTAVENMRGAAIAAAPKVADLGDESKEAGDKAETAWQNALQAMDDFRDGAISAAERLVDEAFDPIITKNEALATAAEIRAEREIIASDKSKKAEIKDAEDQLDSLMQTQADQLIALAEMGETNTAAFKKGMGNLEDYVEEVGGSSTKAGARVQKLIDAINRIPKKKTLSIIIKTLQQSVGKGAQEFAAGGRVNAPVGMPVPATVHGGEFVVPNANGITGAELVGALMSDAATPAGGKTINVNLLDRMGAQTPRDISDGLRMLGERGYL